METSQGFCFEFVNDELVMYLFDKQEGYITKIPTIYERLYKHIKGLHINILWTLEDFIIKNNLKWVDFNDL